MSLPYGYVKKIFLEPEFQHKGINKRKNANSQQNLEVFLASTDSENRIILILHRKGQKIFGQNCPY